MTSIPADSKAFIKPFEGTDVTCLLEDAVIWFGADEIMSILNQNPCSALKNLPLSQKALWKQLEPDVHSEKQFVSSLGVRMLIGRAQSVDVDSCNPHPPSYYNNAQLDNYTSSVCHNQPRFELSCSMHNLGNIFIDEAIYDSRAYPQVEEVNYKINRIYDIILEQANTVSVLS